MCGGDYRRPEWREETCGGEEIDCFLSEVRPWPSDLRPRPTSPPRLSSHPSASSAAPSDPWASGIYLLLIFLGILRCPSTPTSELNLTSSAQTSIFWGASNDNEQRQTSHLTLRSRSASRTLEVGGRRVSRTVGADQCARNCPADTRGTMECWT